ncbi:hypothetical protein Ae150APs1_5612c [Pseudonocardia sp. Ae150A_Ps1]|nr:hypothetical protein Ae150APs1_5612c [Pseudonocardia sp. Ae150A_Ps1]
MRCVSRTGTTPAHLGPSRGTTPLARANPRAPLVGRR